MSTRPSPSRRPWPKQATDPPAHLFRANSVFERQANEALVGNTCTRGAFADGVVNFLGQTQVDGFALRLNLETCQLCAGKVGLRQVGLVDDGLCRAVGLVRSGFSFSYVSISFLCM